MNHIDTNASCSLELMYAVAAGSVVGCEHRRCYRNNQDAVHWHSEPRVLVTAVADGCSSGRHNELGALLTVRWLTGSLPHGWEPSVRSDLSSFVHTVNKGLQTYLRLVGQFLEADPSLWTLCVHDCFLATYLCAVVHSDGFFVFGVGDGVISVNGEVVVLDSGQNNAPDYVGYSLVDSGARALKPMIHASGETRELDTLLIGTDGLEDVLNQSSVLLKDGRPLGDLTQFERDARYLTNPSLLQKRLNVIGPLNNRLSDDASLVLLARREGNR